MHAVNPPCQASSLSTALRAEEETVRRRNVELKEHKRLVEAARGEIEDLAARAGKVPGLDRRIVELEEELATMRAQLRSAEEKGRPGVVQKRDEREIMARCAAHMLNRLLARGFNRIRDESTVRRYISNVMKRCLLKWTKDKVYQMMAYWRDYVEVMRIRELERSVKKVPARSTRQ